MTQSERQKPSAASPDANPVKDLDGDHILKGSECLQQMEAEEEQGPLRTPNEHVHGIFEVIGARSMTAEWNHQVAMGTINTDNLVAAEQKAAIALSTNLQSRVDSYLAAARKNPHLLSETIEAAQQKSFTEDGKEIAVADNTSFDHFARHFHQDFKNGINISKDEVLLILSHFGEVALPTPNPIKTGAHVT